MATAVSTFGAANRGLFNLNGSSAATAVPTVSFFSNGLKKAYTSKFTSQRKFRVVAEVDEKKQTDKDRWKGPVYDVSDDQQDITRGKGMVDSLFQAPICSRTHYAIMSSYDYISAGLRQYNLDNNMDGFYIAPAFMDKLVVHITKNFLTLPNIKVPLILGIWRGKGQGKSFQCELVFAKMGIKRVLTILLLLLLAQYFPLTMGGPCCRYLSNPSGWARMFSFIESLRRFNEEERLKPQPDNIIKSLHDLKDFEKEKTSEKFKVKSDDFKNQEETDPTYYESLRDIHNWPINW